MEPQFTPASPGDCANGTCARSTDGIQTNRLVPSRDDARSNFPPAQFAPMIPVAIQ